MAEGALDFRVDRRRLGGLPRSLKVSHNCGAPKPKRRGTEHRVGLPGTRLPIGEEAIIEAVHGVIQNRFTSGRQTVRLAALSYG